MGQVVGRGAGGKRWGGCAGQKFAKGGSHHQKLVCLEVSDVQVLVKDMLSRLLRKESLSREIISSALS